MASARSRLFLLATAAIVAIAALLFALNRRGPQVPPPAPNPATATIQSTGEILGVAIGSTSVAMRAKLDPLRDPASTERRGKGEEARKVYWKLAGTEYRWIMAWTDDEGRVVQLSVVPRAEGGKPFAEIGDLAAATSAQENFAVWIGHRSDRPPYRLIARGRERKAMSIYMVAGDAEIE